MSDQEKIFKFLWPDKCWHKNTQESYNEKLKLKEDIWSSVCFKCKEGVGLQVNPSLTTPDGMVMILDRLVEMGYEWSMDSKGRKGAKTYVYIVKPDPADPYIYDEFMVEGSADTAPLAVLNATQALMEKEEKE